jgi:starch-binding outer membrane protein SusE/F
MKNYKILLLAIFAMFGLNSCEDKDELVFTASPQGEFTFVNTFLEKYTLTQNTMSNVAERFVFSAANFDTPTPINYVLENSISGDFTDQTVIEGPTTTNEIAVTVGKLLELAETAGIESDVEALLHFRIKAFVGDLDTSTEFTYTPLQSLNILIPSVSTGGSAIAPSTWGVVGSGYNNWGAFADGQFYTTDQTDIFVAYVTLVPGEIKFRENNAWDNDFGDSGADGTLDAGGDNITITNGGTYKITMNLNDNTYTIDAFSWGVVGSGYNDWGATPDAKFYYDYMTDTFKVGVRLVDGEIKFRQNNAWDSDFGDSGADGTLDAGGDNIIVTAGHYTITLDFNTSVYTIELADLYGIVGSGYNDWGATQDFTLTPLSNDIWTGDIAPLVDGEIKFRVNDAWDSDFGDTGADGTLDAGGDNIAVSAGNYRLKLDLANGVYEINQVN